MLSELSELATLKYELTATPSDIEGALSLVDGQLYSCQFNGTGYAKVSQQTSAPDADTDDHFKIPNLEFVDIYVEAGENTYAWVDDPTQHGGNLILSLIPEGA